MHQPGLLSRGPALEVSAYRIEAAPAFPVGRPCFEHPRQHHQAGDHNCPPHFTASDLRKALILGVPGVPIRRSRFRHPFGPFPPADSGRCHPARRVARNLHRAPGTNHARLRLSTLTGTFCGRDNMPVSISPHRLRLRALGLRILRHCEQTSPDPPAGAGQGGAAGAFGETSGVGDSTVFRAGFPLLATLLISPAPCHRAYTPVLVRGGDCGAL
jgi:hypothetical protein